MGFSTIKDETRNNNSLENSEVQVLHYGSHITTEYVSRSSAFSDVNEIAHFVDHKYSAKPRI